MEQSNKSSLILICLGNWGKGYEFTRHNLGFLLADHIAKKTSERFKEINFGEYLCVKNFKKDLYVFKGKTLMNVSGETAKRFLAYLKPKNYEVAIAHDDLDIPFGRIKISKNGGSGGHKGVKSVIENIGKDNIRIRLGIWSEEKEEIGAIDFVLQNFSKEEMEKLPKILDIAFDSVITILNENVDKAMSTFNSPSVKV